MKSVHQSNSTYNEHHRAAHNDRVLRKNDDVQQLQDSQCKQNVEGDDLCLFVFSDQNILKRSISRPDDSDSHEVKGQYANQYKINDQQNPFYSAYTCKLFVQLSFRA